MGSERNWSVFKSSRGRLYYYDQVTGTSQWNVPEEFPPELWDIFNNIESEDMSTPELKVHLTGLMVDKLKETSLLDEHSSTNDIQLEVDLLNSIRIDDEQQSPFKFSSRSNEDLKKMPSLEIEKCFDKILDCVEGSISTLEPIIKQIRNQSPDPHSSLPLYDGTKACDLLADCYSGIVDKTLYDTTLLLENQVYCSQYNYLKNRCDTYKNAYEEINKSNTNT